MAIDFGTDVLNCLATGEFHLTSQSFIWHWISEIKKIYLSILAGSTSHGKPVILKDDLDKVVDFLKNKLLNIRLLIMSGNNANPVDPEQLKLVGAFLMVVIKKHADVRNPQFSSMQIALAKAEPKHKVSIIIAYVNRHYQNSSSSSDFNSPAFLKYPPTANFFPDVYLRTNNSTLKKLVFVLGELLARMHAKEGIDDKTLGDIKQALIDNKENDFLIDTIIEVLLDKTLEEIPIDYKDELDELYQDYYSTSVSLINVVTATFKSTAFQRESVIEEIGSKLKKFDANRSKAFEEISFYNAINNYLNQIPDILEIIQSIRKEEANEIYETFIFQLNNAEKSINEINRLANFSNALLSLCGSKISEKFRRTFADVIAQIDETNNIIVDLGNGDFNLAYENRGKICAHCERAKAGLEDAAKQLKTKLRTAIERILPDLTLEDRGALRDMQEIVTGYVGLIAKNIQICEQIILEIKKPQVEGAKKRSGSDVGGESESEPEPESESTNPRSPIGDSSVSSKSPIPLLFFQKPKQQYLGELGDKVVTFEVMDTIADWKLLLGASRDEILNYLSQSSIQQPHKKNDFFKNNPDKDLTPDLILLYIQQCKLQIRVWQLEDEKNGQLRLLEPANLPPQGRRGFYSIATEELSQKIPLPVGCVYGTAVDDGGCFWDALAQLLGGGYDEKSLRLLTYNYVIDHKSEFEALCKNELHNQSFEAYLNDYKNVIYTARECEQLAHQPTPIMGRTHIEGVIICRALNIEYIQVIEFTQMPEESRGHYLITKEGYRQLSEIDHEDQAIIKDSHTLTLIVTQNDLHFIPVLKADSQIQLTRDNTQPQHPILLKELLFNASSQTWSSLKICETRYKTADTESMNRILI